MFIYVDNGDMTTQRHSNNTNYCTIINNSCWLDWPDILTKPLPSALSKRFHRSWEHVFYGSAPFAWQKAFQFGRLITLHFTPQCYARAICAVVVSVRPSQAGTVTKRLNVGSRKQCRTIAQGLLFTDAKKLGKIPTESSPTGVPNRGGVGSNWRYSTNISLRDIVTTEH